jgi:AraC family transcriptional regulator
MESLGTMVTSQSTMTGVAGRTLGELPACRLRRVTQYIQDNLHRKLRLAELSAQVNMSPYHFARLFKQSTGTSPHRFVLRRRIDRASTLLTTGELSIGEVARLVGFQTTSHFTTVFRRITGLTPGGYRIGRATARLDDRPT